MIRKNFPSLELSNSLEDYIEAVRNIELEKGCAAVGEIAEALNVKKPSVSLAMKQLKERGLVEYTQYSPIVLTRGGPLLRGPGYFLPYHGERIPDHGAEDGGEARGRSGLRH